MAYIITDATVDAFLNADVIWNSRICRRSSASFGKLIDREQNPFWDDLIMEQGTFPGVAAKFCQWNISPFRVTDLLAVVDSQCFFYYLNGPA